MLILKRLAVWLGETSLEVLLLGLALIVLFGQDQHAFIKSLLAYYTGLVLFSFTTGYLFTTVIARCVWKGSAWWSYSAVALVLFLIHSEIFFVLSGGSTRPEQFSMQVAGAFVVFVCTSGGTLLLRRWIAASKESTLIQH
jgi:heme/copper-type cytochrome/quinol oxidase subunit 4